MNWETEDLMICRQLVEVSDTLREYWLKNNSQSNQQKIMSLTISQQRMLRVVWQMTCRNPEGVILRELADKLGLSSSAVSVMVDNLVQKKVLIREQQAEDRRKVLIRLSKENMNEIFRAESGYIPLIEKFREQCDPEKMHCFEEILSELNQFLANNNN